jgi:hypothetical protein
MRCGDVGKIALPDNTTRHLFGSAERNGGGRQQQDFRDPLVYVETVRWLDQARNPTDLNHRLRRTGSRRCQEARQYPAGGGGSRMLGRTAGNRNSNADSSSGRRS